MREHAVGQLRCAVPGFDEFAQPAEVPHAGQPHHPRAVVEHRLDVVHPHPGRVAQIADDAGIDVTAAGSHHQSLQRRQPHRGVKGPGAGDRRRRAAVAQVQHDLFQAAQRPIQEGRGLLADVAVRGAVEPVPADLPAIGQFAVDGVGRRRGRQVVEEPGVEDGHVRNAGQQPAGHFDSLERRRIVQRGQLRQLVQPGDHRVVQHGGPVEGVAAVHHPMTHRDQPGGVEVDAVAGQHVERPAQRGVVVGDRRGFLADAFHDARRGGHPGLGIDQLELQRRRAGVDHQHPARAVTTVHRAAPAPESR